MSPTPHTRRTARFAALSAAALVVAGIAVAVPTTASATTQPVTVVTTVNGGTTNNTFTGDDTTATFAVTNASTNGAKLGAFSIVVPKGVGPVTKAGVNAPGTWLETILPCGSQANCSAIVLVNAWFPLSKSVVGPGGTVRASISFKAPATAGVLSFPLIGIGNGIFTVSGPTPTVNVVDVAASKFGVTVSAPVKAGTPSTLTVTPLTDAGAATQWKGGPVTVTITGDDGRATLDSSAFGTPKATFPSGSNAKLTIANVPAGGAFSLPITFFAAQAQDVTVSSGSLSGTAGGFTVSGAAPASLVLAHVDPSTHLIDPTTNPIRDTSKDPALPNPAAGQSFTVDVALLDEFGNLSPTSGVAVSLATLGAATGTLTSPGPTRGPHGSTTVPAAYTVAANPLALRATSGTFTADGSTTVTSAGTTADLLPGQSTTLSIPAATASLPNGADGKVFLYSQPCVQADPTCTKTTEYTLDAHFKNPDTGLALYTFAAPASLSLGCNGACPHADGNEPSNNYLYNSPAVDPGPFSQADVNEFEQVEDFNRWPLQFAVKNGDGNYPTNPDGTIIFANAPSCVDLTPANAGKTGTIESAAAQLAGFCVDVYAMSRTANLNGVQQFSGDLTRPVLFVEDPKARTP